MNIELVIGTIGGIVFGLFIALCFKFSEVDKRLEKLEEGK